MGDDNAAADPLWLAMDNQGIMSDLYDGDAVLLDYPVKALGDYHDAYVPMGELPFDHPGALWL